MAIYKCSCGHSWSDLTGRYDGYICWQNSQMSEQLAENMLAFCKANTNDDRSEWIAKFFGAQYPVEMSDTSVASDLAASISNDHASLVYRCPQCGSITVYEDGSWMTYSRQGQ